MEESIRLDPRRPAVALNWPVLALAHHRLGHAVEARRWLERAHGREGDAARGIEPGGDVNPKASWQERADFGLLRREADEQILDPAFPADPFQR